MIWRGFESKDNERRIEFNPKGRKPGSGKDSIDLTSMVDVTFLLLVFFMVTASFILGAAVEHPQVSDMPTPHRLEDNDDKIVVDITEYNEYVISRPNGELFETINERHFKTVLADTFQEIPAERLLIRAHVESLHSKVVTAMDVARTIGISRIELTTTDLSF